MTINENFIEADDGKVLFNGETVAKSLYLSVNDSPENWEEVDEETPIELLVKINQTLEETPKEITKIRRQIEAQIDQLDFYESCIAEMAEIVYE